MYPTEAARGTLLLMTVVEPARMIRAVLGLALGDPCAAIQPPALVQEAVLREMAVPPVQARQLAALLSTDPVDVAPPAGRDALRTGIDFAGVLDAEVLVVAPPDAVDAGAAMVRAVREEKVVVAVGGALLRAPWFAAGIYNERGLLDCLVLFLGLEGAWKSVVVMRTIVLAESVLYGVAVLDSLEAPLRTYSPGALQI
ncbi:hypothetical protein QQS21_005851 [Conoideocrella luteorostrata]|uniref:Uncharacterized protein n=1 Tax=Conoideocrella luteorostrata TaxID=1105319 RepID=A0AAJ0G0L3_9HYPO|nr:hypothetical protein QQS21_005851 [Conoideocrella luteorostrata]